MKWKMAKNSLFAMLLRSSWWVSMLIVLGFVLASEALLPKEYVPFGVMGALPFLGIGVLRAWQQFQAPNPKRVAHALQRASELPWRDFSVALQQAFARQGHVVTALPGGAVDLRLSRAGRVTLVSCKRWKAANHGVEPLRELAAAQQAQAAEHCIYISLRAVSDHAQAFAKAQGIELVSDQALARLILEEV